MATATRSSCTADATVTSNLADDIAQEKDRGLFCFLLERISTSPPSMTSGLTWAAAGLFGTTRTCKNIQAGSGPTAVCRPGVRPDLTM